MDTENIRLCKELSLISSGVLPKKEVGGRSLFKFSIFLENIGENGPQ